MAKNIDNTGVFHRLKTVKRTTLLVAAACLIMAGSVPVVRAATIQQKIDKLNAQNTKKQKSVDSLQIQAHSYQDAISKLEKQIGAIENAINASKAEQAKLQQKITEDQQKINYQRKVLGEDLKSMYVNGQMSTIEMLATSKDLSDYLDKQQYSEAVQNKIQDTLNQIIDLQNKLRSQKNEVDQLLQTQQDQQSQLDSDRAQKDHLLSMNQNQQSEYNQQIKHNQKKINQLEAEQAAINAASSRTVAGGFAIPGASNGHGGACDIGHGNGGYPMVWCNADQDSLTTSGGFPNRECTSFAYWYFTSVEGKSLYVTGNAKDWYYTSNRPVTGTPHVGDIFVHTAGPYGHVGIVVGISGGYVQTISMNDDYYGHFYNTREYPISELYYIH